MPEAGSSFDGGENVDKAKSQDALNRARDDAQGQDLGVILIPRLNIEGQDAYRPLALRSCGYVHTISWSTYSRKVPIQLPRFARDSWYPQR